MRRGGPTRTTCLTSVTTSRWTRSVDENVKGCQRRRAGDGERRRRRPLLYTLSGDGSDDFKVDNNWADNDCEEVGLRDAVELQPHADSHRPVPGQWVHHGEHHRQPTPMTAPPLRPTWPQSSTATPQTAASQRTPKPAPTSATPWSPRTATPVTP